MIESPTVQFNNGIAEETSVVTRRFVPDNLPNAKDAIAAWRQRIKREAHKDTPVRIIDAKMFPDGTFGTEALGKGAPLTRNALSDVLAFIDAPRGALGVLSTLGANARAVAFNDLKRCYLDGVPVGERPKRGVVLRAMTLGQTRTIRAFVSPSHSIASGDDIAFATSIERVLGPERLAKTQMRVVRSLDRTDVEVLFPSVRHDATGKGDVVELRARGTNSEVRKASMEWHVGLFRLVCLNGMVRETDSTTVSVRHVGDLSRRMDSLIGLPFQGADQFFHQWHDVQRAALPLPRADFIKALEEKYEKTLPSGIGEKMATLWDADGAMSAGDTWAGAVNAMTRAAQEYGYAQATDVERLAGRLVMAPTI